MRAARATKYCAAGFALTQTARRSRTGQVSRISFAAAGTGKLFQHLAHLSLDYLIDFGAILWREWRQAVGQLAGHGEALLPERGEQHAGIPLHHRHLDVVATRNAVQKFSLVGLRIS